MDEQEDVLEPAAVVERSDDTADEIPSYRREAPPGSRDALVWDVFDDGESFRIDDTREYEPLTETTTARSLVVHPMDDHGVFVVSAEAPYAFTETDEILVEILATTLTAALDRVEQDRLRRDRERELEETNAVLSALFETLPAGVLVEDDTRTVRAANDRLFELFGFSDPPEDVIGMDCRALAEQIGDTFADPDDFVERIDELVTRGESADDELSLSDGRTFERSHRLIDLPEREGHLWMYRDVTDRTEREANLRALNETTRDLMTAETRGEICDRGVEAAATILGLDANAIHLYDDERDALVPIAATDVTTDIVGEVPTFTEGDAIAWRVYQQGEALALDDAREDPDVYDPATPVRSELHLPLGDHGILLAGSEQPDAFDQQDLVFGQILADAITTALDQREQTERLRERERDLKRQNERLEEFTSVVSHDLRNPLNVAIG